MNSNGEVVGIRVAEQEIIRDAEKVLFKRYPVDSSEAKCKFSLAIYGSNC